MNKNKMYSKSCININEINMKVAEATKTAYNLPNIITSLNKTNDSTCYRGIESNSKFSSRPTINPEYRSLVFKKIYAKNDFLETQVRKLKNTKKNQYSLDQYQDKIVILINIG